MNMMSPHPLSSESRKKRRMNVEDASGKGLDHKGRDESEIAREKDYLDSELFQDLERLQAHPILKSALHGNDPARDTGLLGPIEGSCLGPIRDEKIDVSGSVVGLVVQEGLKVRPPSRRKNRYRYAHLASSRSAPLF